MIKCAACRIDAFVAKEESRGGITLARPLQIIIRHGLHPETCKIDTSARVEVEVTVSALCRSHVLLTMISVKGAQFVNRVSHSKFLEENERR